ncbi:biotin synthase (Biotin synthetase) [Treponema primitia ZAS-2]|uniref:Biotin synthase n=1 Tax=Treponema primitia (strain ATCC BAA-887 / DSM 12427 / ZAS-2) TaxID=545694 RepID=F5YPR5_TREPZ|nr:biotin synthase BioB [Treponema primitia]AEF84779.1 biotin synthase (Biotin synthetase) [Treponema primitia ZAS-2]
MRLDLKRDFETVPLTKEEALDILDWDDRDLPTLLDAVYKLRKKYKGNTVGIQILTNGRSGNCSQNCAYCAQSRESSAEIDTYRLVPYEKLARDDRLVKEKGLARHCIGLSGISFTDEEIDEFATYVRSLKKESGTHICCSIGFLTADQGRKLKEAGVNRINHNLNSSRSYYPQICTTHTWDERAANIKMLQGLGFEICCGGIVGLGEARADVADLLLSIREINPQSVPINFLLPLKGTPLESQDTSFLTAEYCLKVLCLARLMVPASDIRCAAGREVYLKGRERQMFMAVDSIFASGYLTAGGQGVDDTIKVITDAGFEYMVEGT